MTRFLIFVLVLTVYFINVQDTNAFPQNGKPAQPPSSTTQAPTQKPPSVTPNPPTKNNQNSPKPTPPTQKNDKPPSQKPPLGTPTSKPPNKGTPSSTTHKPLDMKESVAKPITAAPRPTTKPKETTAKAVTPKHEPPKVSTTTTTAKPADKKYEPPKSNVAKPVTPPSKVTSSAKVEVGKSSTAIPPISVKPNPSIPK